MKTGLRVLLALYCAFAVHTLMEFAWGPDGAVATARLNSYREMLVKNIEELSNRNQELTAQLESLRTDPEKVALAARSMGYYREDEGVIRIEGLDSGEAVYRIGAILEESEPYKPVSEIVRITACILASAFSLILTAPARRYE